MSRQRLLAILAVVLFSLAQTACDAAASGAASIESANVETVRLTELSNAEPQPEVEASKRFNPRLLRRFKPARRPVIASGDTAALARIDLGRMLFYEPRLSGGGKLSCNSCHQLDRYGVDGEPTSRGHNGLRGLRNAPTVYHASVHFAQFWDGRAINMEQQVRGPLLNAREMASPSEQYIVDVLKAIPEYVIAFEKAFPQDSDPIQFENLAAAIGAFERGLITRSRWDKYLEGDQSALTDAEVEGLKIFTNVGCMVCHTGEALGGSMYQKVGVVEPWPNQKDRGRYDVTGAEQDLMSFKVPTLRNVEKTAPYFHDGSADTLDEAVRLMGRHQLGIDLADREVAAILRWFRALTGELPKEYIAKPELPPVVPRSSP